MNSKECRELAIMLLLYFVAISAAAYLFGGIDMIELWGDIVSLWRVGLYRIFGVIG